MTARVFVDTNVLVSARDLGEGAKHRQALEWMRALWASAAGRLSTQVLQEYYVTVTRKLKPGLKRPEARADVDRLLAWDPIELDAGVLARAFEVEERFGLSYWDALVVAAAQAGGCDVLLTEDLRAGQLFDGLEVVSPFGTKPGDWLGP